MASVHDLGGIAGEAVHSVQTLVPLGNYLLESGKLVLSQKSAFGVSLGNHFAKYIVHGFESP
jgi:ssRNA-specific RNase YbeY (16S rRNA maturation enzyme)